MKKKTVLIKNVQRVKPKSQKVKRRKSPLQGKTQSGQLMTIRTNLELRASPNGFNQQANRPARITTVLKSQIKDSPKRI
jgi:hypothetical protein